MKLIILFIIPKIARTYAKPKFRVKFLVNDCFYNTLLKYYMFWAYLRGSVTLK